MHSATAPTTLYDDWLRRRELLRARGARSPHCALHLKVLDYLIDRYRDSPAARRAVRTAHRPEVYFNSRQIIVNDHLGRGRVGGAKSKTEAEQRVFGILQRMSSESRDEDDMFQITASSEPVAPPVKLRPLWRRIVGAVIQGHHPKWTMRAALKKFPYLPRIAVRQLRDRLSDTSLDDVDNENAIELLCACQNEIAAEFAVEAWSCRVVALGTDDEIALRLQEFFCRSEHLARIAERVREQLADDNADVRLAAIVRLGGIGELDDIALLSDLLLLPKADDEHPLEREALADAMLRISQRTSE